MTTKKVTVNKLFPGRPNYAGPTKGWFGLLHHRVLFEHSDNVMERVTYVRKNKPHSQRAIRLRNMVYMGKAFSNVCDAAGLHQNDGEKPERFLDYALAYIKMIQPDTRWVKDGLTFDNGTYMH